MTSLAASATVLHGQELQRDPESSALEPIEDQHPLSPVYQREPRQLPGRNVIVLQTQIPVLYAPNTNIRAF